MPLLEQLQKDMVAAMKAKEETRLSAIRMVKTALQKLLTDGGKPVDEAAEIQLLSSLVKQRKESIDMFSKAGRQDLADKEIAELAVIEGYLPAAPTEEEMTAAIQAALAETGVTDKKQMGVVMKAAQAKLAGKRVDGKLLSDKIRGLLQ